MGAVDIDAILAGLRVEEDVGLAVREVLPGGQIGVQTALIIGIIRGEDGAEAEGLEIAEGGFRGDISAGIDGEHQIDRMLADHIGDIHGHGMPVGGLGGLERELADLLSGFGIVEVGADGAGVGLAAELQIQLHDAVGGRAEVEVLVAGDRAVNGIGNHMGVLVQLEDVGADLLRGILRALRRAQIAGDVGVVGRKGIERAAGETLGGHLGADDGAVGVDGDGLGAGLTAGPPAGALTVGMAVIEDVELLIQLKDAAMDVAIGEGGLFALLVLHDAGVGDDDAAEGEGAGGLGGGGIGILVLLLVAPDQIIGAVDLTDGGAFVEGEALNVGNIGNVGEQGGIGNGRFHLVGAGDQADVAALDGEHVVLELHHLALAAGVQPVAAVVIHQDGRVEGLADLLAVGIVHAAVELEGAAGVVADGDAAAVVQIVLAVLEAAVGGKDVLALVTEIGVLGFVVQDALAGPVGQVADGSGPGHVVAQAAAAVDVGQVMGAVDVDAILAGLRIKEDVGLAVCEVLPGGQIGVGAGGGRRCLFGGEGRRGQDAQQHDQRQNGADHLMDTFAFHGSSSFY